MCGAQVPLRGVLPLRGFEPLKGNKGEKKPIKIRKTHLKPSLRCLWGLVAAGLNESCLREELQDFYTNSGGFCLKTERGRRFPHGLGHVTRGGREERGRHVQERDIAHA